MAEVIHVFDGRAMLGAIPYVAQVVGRPAGHIWEGWIEFAAVDGTDARRTPRETTQPDREALVYWATGLSPTYLEGAIQRTLPRPPVRELRPEMPLFESPAPARVAEVAEPDRAVLDPFSVGAKGEDLLRRELGALAAWHLRNIVRGYHLAEPSLDLERLSQAELIELIVTAVQPV